MSTNTGFSYHINGRVNILESNLNDKTTIYDDLLEQKKAVIAHRFGKLTFQPYTIESIELLLKKGIQLIEIDVNLTQDTTEADRIFYLSHGNMEEVNQDDKPTTITKDNYNSVVVNNNNNYMAGGTLSSLKNFFEYVKNRDVCILMEDKSGQPQKLLDFCEDIGLTPKHCIFQDFDNSALDIFKGAGFKTMKIGGSLTTQEISDYDYFCCGSANLATFQGYNIDKFIYYTNLDAIEFNNYKSSYSKLSGCFSDNPIITFYDNITSDLSLLNPKNGFISIYNTLHNSYKYTRYWLEGNSKIKAQFLPHSNPSNKSVITCHGYKLKQDKEYYFKPTKYSANDNNHWFGLVIRFSDYTEYDSQWVGAINLLFRYDERYQLYTFQNGNSPSLQGTEDYSGNNYKYFKFKISPDDNDSSLCNVDMNGSITEDGTYTLIRSFSFNYSNVNGSSTSDLYLSIVKRDSWSGEVEFKPY
ncbi:MAG: hypothetical protein H6630_08910 [Arcobacter sp.]|nr:hypothetical protein [Arcobacter sp.]